MAFLKNTKAHLPIIVLLVSLGIMLIGSLNKAPLANWDECIYAEYGQEMYNNGDFGVNYWNGSPIYEKLPLYSILMQIPYQFGINEVTARIWTVVFVIALLGMIYVYAYQRFSQKVALLAVLLMLVNEIFARYIFRVNTDMGNMVFIFGALILWFESEKRPKLVYPAGFLLALSVLIKGFTLTPIVIALGLILFLDFKKRRLLDYVLFGCTSLLVLAPVIVYEYSRFGSEFIHEYFYEAHIRRAQFPIEFHLESRLFYFKNLLQEFFPWIGFGFVYGLLFAWTGFVSLKKKRFKKWIQEHREVLILLIMVFCVLFFITRAASKLAWYAMPLYPFMAIYLAYSIDWLASKAKKYSHILMLVVILIVAAEGFNLVWRETYDLPTKQTFYSQEAFKAASKYPQSELELLVPYSERRAREVLTLPYYTTFTWRYGGAPCAPFYSKKKVNYYYSESEFHDILGDTSKLYLIENGDENKIEKENFEVLYNNVEFTIFRYVEE